MRRRTAGGRHLPVSLDLLLGHVQDLAVSTVSEKVAARLVRFLQCISPRITDNDTPEVLGKIDVNVARPLCSEGVPDEAPPLRAALWKILLGYLPADVFQWDDALAQSRKAYAGFVQELLEQFNKERCVLNESSKQPGMLLDILDEINKDIFRTRTELDFFVRSIAGSATDDAPAVTPNASSSLDGQSEMVDVARPRLHYDALARVLLLFARLNPGIRYVQGMNELCAPIYFLFAQDRIDGGANVEADTFFCFSLLMANMRDAFQQNLDSSEAGLLGLLEQFGELLQEKDPEVSKHFEALNLNTVFFATRWLTLLLAQELEMPDVLRLWDSLLADMAATPRRPLLHYVCVAMVISIRDALLAGDFTDCMRLLQHLPPLLVDDLLCSAARLRSADVAQGGFSNSELLAQEGDAAAVSAGALAAWGHRQQQQHGGLRGGRWWQLRGSRH